MTWIFQEVKSFPLRPEIHFTLIFQMTSGVESMIRFLVEEMAHDSDDIFGHHKHAQGHSSHARRRRRALHNRDWSSDLHNKAWSGGWHNDDWSNDIHSRDYLNCYRIKDLLRDYMIDHGDIHGDHHSVIHGTQIRASNYSFLNSSDDGHQIKVNRIEVYL